MSEDTSNSNGNTSGSKDLYPLALLMDELKHDDIANRVEAMKKLDTIALALGPQTVSYTHLDVYKRQAFSLRI